MARTALTTEAIRAAITAIQMPDDHGPCMKQKIIQLRDFFWDRVITTIIFLIFGVTSVQAIVSYFDDGGLRCWTPENYSIAVIEYIDRLCRKDVPNYGKFYSISLYAEVALLSGFHIFWNQVWSGRIENFKSTVSSMSLKRSTITGHFEPSDHEAVRYLERNLESTALTWTYMLKTGGQVILSALSISFLVFYPELGYSFAIDPTLVFECNNESLFEGQWPLAEPSINCALTELANLQILRWFNFVALVIVLSANVVGAFFLAYGIYFYHLLDYKRVARFILYTGLRRDHYPQYHYKSGCNRKYEMCSNGCTHSCGFLLYSLCWWCKTTKCLGESCCCPCAEENFTRGLIPFDMSFLIVRLLGTDTKLGEALLDVLIDNHLDYLIKNECSEVARSLKNNDDKNNDDKNDDKNNTDGNGGAKIKRDKDDKRSSLGKIIREASSALDNEGTDAASSNTALNNCILITTDNESLAYLVDSYGIFKKVVCINFNSAIRISQTSKESETEKQQFCQFCHGRPLIYRIASQTWSVNETMNKELKSPCYETVDEAIKYLNKDGEAHATVIVLAPLSDEVYIRQGDLHNTMQRVVSLLQYIQRQPSFIIKDKLYLLSVIPESIANKADVSSEFCWGKDEDRDQFPELIKSECSSSSYTWGEPVKKPATRQVEGVKYSVIKYARVTKKAWGDKATVKQPGSD